MSTKPKVKWTQREQAEVFAKATELMRSGAGSISRALREAQEVLPEYRRMAPFAFYPSGRVAKEFRPYFAALAATKMPPLAPPIGEERGPWPGEAEQIPPGAPPVISHHQRTTVEKPTVPLAEHVRRLAAAIADEIARQVEAHLASAVRRLTEDLSRAPEPAQRRAKKIIVVGVEPSKANLLRSAFAGRLDLRFFDQDQEQRIKQVAQSWSGTTIVMANLVSHSAAEAFKNSDLWRVNSFEELRAALDEIAKEQS